MILRTPLRALALALALAATACSAEVGPEDDAAEEADGEGAEQVSEEALRLGDANRQGFKEPQFSAAEKAAVLARYTSIDPNREVPRVLLENALQYYDFNKSRLKVKDVITHHRLLPALVEAAHVHRRHGDRTRRTPRGRARLRQRSRERRHPAALLERGRVAPVFARVLRDGGDLRGEVGATPSASTASRPRTPRSASGPWSCTARATSSTASRSRGARGAARRSR
jgi:hypothetical protein